MGGSTQQTFYISYLTILRALKCKCIDHCCSKMLHEKSGELCFCKGLKNGNITTY